MGSTTETSASVRIGAMVGPYRLVRVIGCGGMGAVFEAVHERIGQRAAVKVLFANRARDSGYIDRFTQEARAASAVRHPGLVQVFDSGTLEDGTPFLLMELVVGASLRQRLREDRLGLEQASRVIRALASALSAVHASDIVHRDVKPENVMLVRDDAAESGERPKLLDFGIARFASSEGRVAPQFTQEGVVIGTPEYMAPEQCLPGDEITTAVDVYALGVILFEMLAGTAPFVGGAPTVMRAHLFEQPPLAAVESAPEAVRGLIARMLAKKAQDRPTAAEVAERLAAPASRDAAHHASLRASKPTIDGVTRPSAAGELSGTPRRRSGVPRTLAVAAAALALAGAGASASRAVRRPRPTIRLTSTVAFAGGSFTMGRTVEEIDRECALLGSACRRDVIEREQPARVVRVSPFRLDTYEATNVEVAAWLSGGVVRVAIRPDGTTHAPRYIHDASTSLLLADTEPATPYGGLEIRANETIGVRSGYADRAAVQLTWEAARLYCASRGKRLPTEAEWEFAARGGGSRRFPWGDDEPRCDGVVVAREDGRECSALPRGPQPVSAGDQDWTAEGVHGMGGNVSEWVKDAFVSPHYPDCGGCSDPVERGDSSHPAEFRVFRGGAWANSILTHASARGRWEAASVSASLGVRCAFTADR